MLFQLFSQVLFQPLNNVRVLMQLGFEPLPLQPGYSFTGEKMLFLPNAITYMNYIYKHNGISGLYTGILPRLCQRIIAVSLSENNYVQEKFNLINNDPVNNLPNQMDNFAEMEVNEVAEIYADTSVHSLSDFYKPKEYYFDRNSSLKSLFKLIKKQIITETYSLVLTYPFQLISIRMVGQLVGHETKYNGVINSIYVIYNEEGLNGFYQGFFSKLLAEVAFITSMSVVMFILKKYILSSKKNRVYSSILCSYFFRVMLYPLELVSTCMAVNNTGLSIASVPYTINFDDSFACLSYLSTTNQLKRGSRLFHRSVPNTIFKYQPSE